MSDAPLSRDRTGHEPQSEGVPSDYPPSVIEWLEEQPESVGSLLAVLQTQREHPDLYLEAITAVQQNTKRKILHAITHHHGPVGYDELTSFTNVSRRSIRTHINDLVDRGLLNKSQSRCTVVSFANDHVEVLVHHALTTLYDTIEQ